MTALKEDKESIQTVLSSQLAVKRQMFICFFLANKGLYDNIKIKEYESLNIFCHPFSLLWKLQYHLAVKEVISLELIF